MHVCVIHSHHVGWSETTMTTRDCENNKSSIVYLHIEKSCMVSHRCLIYNADLPPDSHGLFYDAIGHLERGHINPLT